MSPGSIEAIRMRALHHLARAALRFQSPLDAKSTVDRVGRRFATLAGDAEARAAMMALMGAGTCLSRALAVAARLRGAEVVIGVDPWSSFRPSAHAWIEVDGARVDAGSGASNAPEASRIPWEEIARLPPTGR